MQLIFAFGFPSFRFAVSAPGYHGRCNSSCCGFLSVDLCASVASSAGLFCCNCLSRLSHVIAPEVNGGCNLADVCITFSGKDTISFWGLGSLDAMRWYGLPCSGDPLCAVLLISSLQVADHTQLSFPAADNLFYKMLLLSLQDFSWQPLCPCVVLYCHTAFRAHCPTQCPLSTGCVGCDLHRQIMPLTDNPSFSWRLAGPLVEAPSATPQVTCVSSLIFPLIFSQAGDDQGEELTRRRRGSRR